MSSATPLPPALFDRSLYLARQRAASGELVTLLDDRLREEVQERLAVINRQFQKALLIAPRPEGFASALSCLSVEQRWPAAREDLQLPSEAYDCVVSLLDLHAVNDVPGYLAQVAQSLVPDGLALFAFFAGDTLRELRDAFLVAEQERRQGVSPRVAPMIDLREAGGLLQRAGLALPVADLDRVPLTYGEAITLMRDIKSLGFANCLMARSRGLTTPALIMAAASHYGQVNGRLPATVDIAWAMAWKPHPSQQQPLKPGSAKARLAEALASKI